jgi:hypothetical protein
VQEHAAYQCGLLFLFRTKGLFGRSLAALPVWRDESVVDFIDIQPEQNALLAFPSWAAHEVLPITCPSVNGYRDPRIDGGRGRSGRAWSP